MTVAPWIQSRSDARFELRRLNAIHSDLLRWSEQTSQLVVRARCVERLPEIERQIAGLREFLRA
jgi:hypothetical protein